MFAALFLLCLLIIAFAAAYYFGSTQKTQKRPPRWPNEAFYRSKGLGNVFDAREQTAETLNVIGQKSGYSRRQRRRHA